MSFNRCFLETKRALGTDLTSSLDTLFDIQYFGIREKVLKSFFNAITTD